MCKTESLCSTAEIDTILSINYMLIKLFKKLTGKNFRPLVCERDKKPYHPPVRSGKGNGIPGPQHAPIQSLELWRLI